MIGWLRDGYLLECKKLKLDAFKIDDKYVKELCEALNKADLKELTELSLYKNSIGAEGMEAIGKAI